MVLKYALLGLLCYSPMSGYDLSKMFSDSIDHFWHASMSQVYRELNGLEDSGYLTSSVVHQCDKPDRRVYHITHEGRAAFKNWLEDFPENPVKNTRDEFSLRIFFGGGMSRGVVLKALKGFKEQKQHNIEEIKRLEGMSQQYAQRLSLFISEERYWKFILKKAHMTLEAQVRWADECIDDLEKEKDDENNG